MGGVQALNVALRALVANKLRTGLTMLGMIIGVGAVVALTAIGQGATASVTQRIQGLGTNLLFISPGAQRQEGGVRSAQGTAPTLTYEDAVAIADPSNVPLAVAVSPEANSFGQLIAGGQNVSTRVNGVTPDYAPVHNFNIASGSFITPQHLEGRAAVAVLGSAVAQNLFGDADPVGQTMRASVNGTTISLRVVGVLESKGGSGLGNQDDVVLVPLTSFQSKMQNQRNARGGRNVNQIAVQVQDEKSVTEATQQIQNLLIERHKVAQPDFTIQSQQDILGAINQVTGILTVLLGSIAGISLVVGGIGIMNIMLVSVTERTREIGIRKAVGAKRRDILAQFLVESVLVSVGGGGIGLLLGFLSSRIVTNLQIQGLQAVVTPTAVILAFGVSTIVGIFFGIYPATRAARLHPIEALRYE